MARNVHEIVLNGPDDMLKQYYKLKDFIANPITEF